MKKMKKIMAFVLAMAMVLGINVMTAFAAPASGTITINPPANASGTNTYKIYKVFDATVGSNGEVAYKLLPGVADSQVPAGFTAANGYITDAPDSLDEAASAIANYDKKVLVDTVETTGTTPGTSNTLEPGYYYISTTTGTAVVVGDGANVTVDDKNILSIVEKSAGSEYDAESKKAIAAVGSSQDFTAQIKVGKGTTKLEFTDTMTNMTYNGDVSVKIGATPVDSSKYTISGNKGDSTFGVSFASDYVKSLADDTIITLNYSATITSDALTTNPAKNTASLKTDNDNTTSSEAEVYNATLTVDKIDGDKKALVGAGFTLSKKNADGSYSVIDTINSTDNNEISEFVFKGLGAGEYKLEETQVPAGYNKADDVTFTISDSDFTAKNLIIGRTVINNSGATLPSTGGMGTTIFYALGAVLVIGAGILLVTRRRMAK